jgi:hypothetical protein
MHDARLLAILTLDWSRLRRGFLTIGGALVAVVAFLAVTNRLTLENAVVFGIGFSMGPLFSIGVLGIRDRLEGTLGLMASLPVPAGQLAMLRLTSLALLVLPLALVDGLLIGGALPANGMPASAAIGIAVGAWVGLGSAALWLAALSIAFPPQRASHIFSIGFLAFLVSMTVLDRFVPTPEDLIRLLLDPGRAWLIPAILACLAVTSALGAWALTAWGIRNYTMEAERPG